MAKVIFATGSTDKKGQSKTPISVSDVQSDGERSPTITGLPVLSEVGQVWAIGTCLLEVFYMGTVGENELLGSQWST